MKKIIHPTDFSDNASKALEFAIGFCKKFDAELILLHIGDLTSVRASSSTLHMFSELEKKRLTSIYEQLKKYASEKIQSTDKDIRIQYKATLNSSSANGILETIDETGADLVVTGTKGESELKQIIMGSTAKELVTMSPCPVLAVPAEASFREIKHIVYASDYDPHDTVVINQLVDLAQVYDAEISAFHVFKKEPEKDSDEADFPRKLADSIGYSKFNSEFTISDNVARSLADFVQHTDADLLVFYQKESKGIRGFFHKGIVKQFVDYSARIPLLSFNEYSVQHSRN